MPNDSKRSFNSKQASLPKRQIIMGAVTLAVIAFVLALSLRPTAVLSPPISEPGADQAGAVVGTRVAQGSVIIQHISYTPCGHSITRRMDMPTELVGKERGDIEAVYDLYRITSFSPTQVEMERELNMYCAAHVVLMPDESGYLCVFQNKYGDALALVSSLEMPLTDLSQAVQEEIKKGKGFDDLASLEQWLESVES